MMCSVSLFDAAGLWCVENWQPFSESFVPCTAVQSLRKPVVGGYGRNHQLPTL